MSKSSVLIFNGGSVGEGASSENTHNLQLGVMSVNSSEMYVLLDKSMPIESAPGYAPVDRYALAEWIQRGDVVQMDCANISPDADASYTGTLLSTTNDVNSQGIAYADGCTIRLDIKLDEQIESRFYDLETVHDELLGVWYLAQDVNGYSHVFYGSTGRKIHKLHRYSFGDGTVDGETPIYGSWLIDLDKPDPNGPEGYARVTPAEFWQSTAVNGEVPVYLPDKNANNSLTYAYLSRTDVTKSGSTVTSVFAYFVRSGYGNDLASSVGFRFTKYPGSDYLQKAAATEDHFTALSQTSGDGSDVTATFTEAQTRANIGTGEKLSILFGKVKKWFTDLKALAFKDKVNTNDIDDDAVTADKVKDNETLPVNITGSAKSLASSLCSYGSSGSNFRLVAKSAPLGNNVNVHFEYRISASNYNLFQSATLQFNAVYNESTNSIVFDGAKVINGHGSSNLWKFYLVPNVAEQKVEIYAESTGSNYNSLNLIALFANGEGQNYINGTTYFNTVVNSIPTPNVAVPVRTAVSTETGVGNATTPVYIDNQGVPQPCTTLWNSIKNNISSNTANVNQVDSNTETSSFTFVNGHVYNLTLTLEGSPLLISSTSSGTGYVAAYIGSSMSQRHYTCKQSVDIQSGELTMKDIKLPVNWKAENITGSSDNQIHVVVVFNSTFYGFSTASPYQLILQGTDFDGASQ